MKLIGDFGKHLTAFLIQKKYGEKTTTVIRVESDKTRYGLTIENGIPNSPFSKRTRIVVNTRRHDSQPEVIPPTKEQLSDLSKEDEGGEFDLWISYVKFK